MLRARFAGLTCALMLALACGGASAAPIGTAFTYQGQLTKQGTPVNGTADLKFSLFTEAIGGSQVGTTQTIPAVPVIDGQLSTQVDFGVSPYTSGNEYWLQIEVRNPAGGNGAYSLLGARQRMSAAPFSLFSKISDSTRGITVDSLGRVTLNPTGPGSQNDQSFTVTAANPGMVSALAVSNGGFLTRLETLIDATSAGNPGHVTIRAQSPGVGYGDLRLNPTGNVIVGEQYGNLGIGTSVPNRPLHVRGPGGVIQVERNSPDPSITIARFADGGDFSPPTEWKRFAIATSGTGRNNGKLLFNDDQRDSGGNGVINTRMVIDNDGNVGIGTTNPVRGKVEIDGSAGLSGLLNHGFFGPGGVAPNIASFAGATSLHASGDIHAWVFRAFSDARIKNIVGRSDAAQDLETLQQIEVTDYTFKDTVVNGVEAQKKVIGQQVEEVYPLAVRRTADIVPDIYKKAPVQGGWIALATDLKVGDKVRLIGMTADVESEVVEIRDGGFRVANLPTGDEVFVYGREVSDFRVVDYEAISMLNVSATQELARRNLALEQRVRELEARIEAGSAKSAEVLSARIEKLEALLSADRVAQVPAK